MFLAVTGALGAAWLQFSTGGSGLDRNVFLNQQRAAQLETLLKSSHPPVQEMALRVNLAWELLRAGRTSDCIEQVRQIRAATRDWPIPEDAPVNLSLHELLALAYLRLGEQENCFAAHSGDACLLPVRPGAVHRKRHGSEEAVGHLKILLRHQPGHLGFRWLLNLGYMTLGEYPDGVPERWRIAPSVFESEFPLTRFDNQAARLGVDVEGLAGGSILEDFDGDGKLDLAVSSWGAEDPLRYFHNQGEAGFVEWTGKAGLQGQRGGLNLTHGDFDGDGRPDILVLRGGWLGYVAEGLGDLPNTLLRNRGDGTFEDVTRAAGLFDQHPSQTAAWADYDLDGRLDLFVGNESIGRDRHPCRLFRNHGDGTFTDVAPAVGLDHVGFVKGAAWGDFDDDGYPDLYLSRFGQPNILFHNVDGTQGARRFQDVTARAGVAEPALSFPTWFWDYDNDGREDLFAASFASYSGDTLEPVVADYLRRAGAPKGSAGEPAPVQYSRLYRNRGDGTFEDVTRRAGLDPALMAMGANFGDLDNDGYLDAYFGTGQPRLGTLIPNRMFRNDGGRRFQDVTSAGGFGHLQKGHGISFGDIDNDGDQDIHAVLGGAYSGDVSPNALFVNPGNSNSWVRLVLQGVAANRSAVGARVRLRVRTDAGVRDIHRTVSTGGSFGSSSLRLEVGLGAAQRIEELEIRWPDRARSADRWANLAPNREYHLRQGQPPVGAGLVPDRSTRP